jgi:hypothetical protein
MTAPKRIQRQRTKGWRMPEGAVYVGRPTRWGNPWFLGSPLIGHRPDSTDWDGDDIVRWYRLWVHEHALAADPSFLDTLRGRDLACWCSLDQPCHADVLLELANRVEAA